MVALGIGSVLFIFRTDTNSEDIPLQNNQNNSMATTETVISFLGVEYYMPLPEQNVPGSDYTALFKEVLPLGEAFDNWTSMITSQRLTPLSAGPEISAESYTNNLLDMHRTQGAQILETTVLSNPEWETVGIDTSNPPYLLIFVYNIPQTTQAEFSIATIRNNPAGHVDALIYSKQLPQVDVPAFLESQEYGEARIGVATMEWF